MRRPASPYASLFTEAPKWASIFSVWSRLASLSITIVRPGELRPASSTADLICAEATGVRYSIGAGSPAPCSRIGQRPPSPCSSVRAPISSSGSRMRRIGRERRLESPSNVALIGEGFMGRTHSNGWSQVAKFFKPAARPVMHTVCGRREEPNKAFANHWGWDHGSGNWKGVVNNPEIDLVDVVTPNSQGVCLTSVQVERLGATR